MGNGKPPDNPGKHRKTAGEKRADPRFRAAFLSAPSYAVMAV